MLLNYRVMSQNNCTTAWSAQQSEDLNYFEERLKSNLSAVTPNSRKWKVIFGLAVCWVTFSLWRWWSHFDYDQEIRRRFFKNGVEICNDNLCCLICKDPIISSLLSDVSLILSLAFICLLLLMGGHHRLRAPSIIAGRSRQVLRDYNMSIDNVGRLILLPSKPRPANGNR